MKPWGRKLKRFFDFTLSRLILKLSRPWSECSKLTQSECGRIVGRWRCAFPSVQVYPLNLRSYVNIFGVRILPSLRTCKHGYFGMKLSTHPGLGNLSVKNIFLKFMRSVKTSARFQIHYSQIESCTKHFISRKSLIFCQFQ